MNVDYIKNGDCLELMKEIPDKSIDMILCDLPYGTTACKWDIIIPFEPLWEQYNRIIKENGVVLLFGSEPFSTYLRMSNIKNYRYDWIWIKERATGFNYAKYQPLRLNENIMCFYKNKPYYDSIGKKLEKPYKHCLPIYKSPSANMTSSGLDKDGNRIYKEYTHAHKNNILYFNRVSNRKTIHPTQKPVELLEYLIKTYTKENEIILDNCMGGGSTCVAAINTNRHYIGFELDKNYFEIADKRIKETIEEKEGKNE